MDKLSGLLEAGRIEDLFIIVRYTYRMGEPLVADSFYDNLERYCKEQGIAREYLERTYDDDPVPHGLLTEFGLEHLIPDNAEERSEYYQYLNEEKSLSIEAVTEYEDAYKFVQAVAGNRLIAMIKVDGIFTKKLIKDQEFKIGLSRGRSGESWDLTPQMRHIIPNHFPQLEKEGEYKVYSESFAVTDSLEYLAGKYDPNPDPQDRKYKTEKSTAVSMLRKMHQKEDYAFVRTLTFDAEGLGTSISESLERAKELGFPVVPYMLFEPGEVPLEPEKFNTWLRVLLDKMWRLGIGIPSDGVVLSVDSHSFDAEIKHQYSSRNIALKLEHWSARYYPAVVKDIIMQQRRVYSSCKVGIEPVIASDRTKATVINCHNPAILIENGIKKGSRIYFERNSGAVNILIHGGRMRKLELEEAEFSSMESLVGGQDDTVIIVHEEAAAGLSDMEKFGTSEGGS
jgi:NAD-dependent DNA ligase